MMDFLYIHNMKNTLLTRTKVTEMGSERRSYIFKNLYSVANVMESLKCLDFELSLKHWWCRVLYFLKITNSSDHRILHARIVDIINIIKYWPFVNFSIGIGTGIGNGIDATNAIISTSTRPIGTKPSRVVN